MIKQNLKVIAYFVAITAVISAFYFLSLTTVSALKP